MELLVIISIIGLLSSVIMVSMRQSREKAYYSRAAQEMRSMANGFELYYSEHNAYPADANRGVMPSGMNSFLPGGWPDGPWPGSVYDWDGWADPERPGQMIYQISLRFCAAGGGSCSYPNMDWAEDFGVDSAVYFCLSGTCRSHVSHPVDYPGKRVN